MLHVTISSSVATMEQATLFCAGWKASLPVVPYNIAFEWAAKTSKRFLRSGILTFLFWSLTSNYWSMEIFFASRERFFSFIVFVAVLIFGFEQIIFSFTVSCTDISRLVRLIDISSCINLPSVLSWIDIPSAYVYRIRMCLIKVNQVETSLENISQGLYWAFSPSNVDTYFHCFHIPVRTKIIELSLAGCRS